MYLIYSTTTLIQVFAFNISFLFEYITSVVLHCLDLQTFNQADSNGDGKIDPKEWEEFVKKNPAALRNMSLPYLQ